MELWYLSLVQSLMFLIYVQICLRIASRNIPVQIMKYLSNQQLVEGYY